MGISNVLPQYRQDFSLRDAGKRRDMPAHVREQNFCFVLRAVYVFPQV
jgi:hypothetical protein